MAARWIEWLRLRGVRLNPNVEGLLERLFALAPATPHLALPSVARWTHGTG
jgi:hypothetical protein